MPDCKTCGKTYSKTSSLKRHQELHLDVRAEHRCNVCGKSIKRLDLFRRHQKTHTGEGWVYCSYCTKGFNRKGQLAKHEEKCHMRLESVARTEDAFHHHSKNNELIGHGPIGHPDRKPLQVVQMPGSQTHRDDLRQQRRLRVHQLQSSQGQRSLVQEVKIAIRRGGVKEIRNIIATLPKTMRSISGLDVLCRESTEYEDDYNDEWEHLSTLLSMSLAYNRRDLLGFLIQSGLDVNEMDSRGRNQLHWAAEENQVERVEWLLDHGADIDFPTYGNSTGQTALNLAVYWGARDAVRLLLRKGAALKMMYSSLSGSCSLLVDAMKHVDILELLLKSQQGEYGGTALHVATREGKMDAMKLLLDFGANIDSTDHFGETPLVYSIWEGQRQAFDLLLERGASVDGAPGDYGTTPLMAAAEHSGGLEYLELLIQAGARINICRPNCGKGGSVTALSCMCDGSDILTAKDKIELLLAAGADVNLGQITPLENALKYQNSEIVELLLETGAKVSRLPEKCTSDLRAKASDPTKRYYGAYEIDPKRKVAILEHYSRLERDEAERDEATQGQE